MKRTHSIAAIALTGLMGFSAVSAPIAARASEEGKRNTAIGIGAAAIALLLTQHNKVPGLIAAGGAAIAYSQINNHGRNWHGDNRYGYNNGYSDRNNYSDHSGYNSNAQRDQNRNDQNRNNNDARDNRGQADNGYRYREDSAQTYQSNRDQGHRGR